MTETVRKYYLNPCRLFHFASQTLQILFCYTNSKTQKIHCKVEEFITNLKNTAQGTSVYL